MTLHHVVTGAEGANPSIFRDIITLPKSGLVLSIAKLPNGRVVTVGKSMGGRS